MSKERKIILFVCRLWLLIIFLATNFDDAHAWGSQGHRAIGYIAEFNLASETKKYIFEEFNINNLADVAIWSDIIKKKRENEQKKPFFVNY